MARNFSIRSDAVCFIVEAYVFEFIVSVATFRVLLGPSKVADYLKLTGLYDQGEFSVEAAYIVLALAALPPILGLFVFKQTPVRLKHKNTGMRMTARLGWSWTYFYFGSLVPLCRNEFKLGAIYAILDLATFGLFNLIWSFLYNKQHVTRLLMQGWVLDDTHEREMVVRNQLGMRQ